jgi:hypothetical protein
MNWSYESTPTEHTWHTPESSTTTSGGPSTREIEDLARQTADEIDRTVISLRGGAAGEVEAPAGLTSRGTLVAQHAASGLVVTVDTAGTPRPLATPLRGPFRMMQRSNAPGPVDVRQRGGVDSAPRSPVVPDGSVTGRSRSTEFRYGQTVLLVQLVDVRPRRLDDVRHNGSEGGPAGSGEPDGGRSCPPSRVIEAPRVV